jgi:pilus assembly protein CpaE
MTARIDIIVIDDGSADEEVVRALLSADGDLRVVAYVEGIGHHTPAADVLVVACAEYGKHAAQSIRDAVEDRPGCPVVLVTQGAPNGYVEDAFEAGVVDIVVLPQPCDVSLAEAMSHQVRFTLNKAVAKRAAGAPQPDGKMIVMLGPKGGSGKTLTSTNLAASLADAGRRVTLVDLDLQFGDVGLALGLTPDRTVYDLITSGGSLDAEKLETFLVTHESGAKVLLAPTRPDQAGLITIDFLRDVYAVLRTSNDVILVDTPPSFTPEVIAAIDVSTGICMVGMLDALSLKNVRLGLETLQLMGYADADIRLVLNRADSQVGINLDDVEAIVGRMPDVLIPSDRAVTRSVNEGAPIALSSRKSEAGRAFHQLAALYMDVAEVAPKRRRRIAFTRAS